MNNRVSTTTEHLLSVREKDVARLLAWGFVQKEIADKLYLSQLTISVHLRNIYRKLAIHKETDLCRWWIFYEYGIADNPFKKLITVLFLVLSISAIVTENNMIRAFKNAPMRTYARAVKPVRVKRYRNVFELQLVTA